MSDTTPKYDIMRVGSIEQEGLRDVEGDREPLEGHTGDLHPGGDRLYDQVPELHDLSMEVHTDLRRDEPDRAVDSLAPMC